MNVLVVGASENPSRYSYLAIERLVKAGHTVMGLGLKPGHVHGVSIDTTIQPDWKPDTITLYVAPNRLESLMPELLALRPKRIIFNPGTESEALEGMAQSSGAEVLEACTLVMLASNVF